MTSLSSLSSGTLNWLETPFIDEVYYAMLLDVSHLVEEEEEEEVDIAASYDSPHPKEVSQQRRIILAEDDDKDEDEEGLTMTHPSRWGPQLVIVSSTGGAPFSGPQGTIQAGVQLRIRLQWRLTW